MTKDEWEKVKTALTKFYSVVKLKVDGYEISLTLVRISQFKNAIAIYVNGEFKGKWLIEDCEERRRFIQKRERSLYKQSEVKKLPKKMQKNMLSKKFEYYQLHWSSFGSLKKHLITNNKSIEFIEIT